MTAASQVDERSSNEKKHESNNPIQRALIERFHERAIAAVNFAGPGSILELGCGEGYVLDALSKGGVEAELNGVELNERAVGKAQARLGSARGRPSSTKTRASSPPTGAASTWS